MRRHTLFTSSEAGLAFDGHSMVGSLQRVLVCSPRTAGWNQPERASAWRELGFHYAPDCEKAQSQHAALVSELKSAGAEVVELPPGDALSLDAVYANDASLSTDFGLVLMRPGKANRVAEARHHGSSCSARGIPTFGAIIPPGTTEAGDMVWLDSKTLLLRHGSRTTSTRAASLRSRSVGLPAPDVIDQPARRANRAGRSPLAGGRDGGVAQVARIQVHLDRRFRTRHARLQCIGARRESSARDRRESQDQRPPAPRRIRRPHLPWQRNLHQWQRRHHLPHPPAAARLSSWGDSRLGGPAERRDAFRIALRFDCEHRS